MVDYQNEKRRKVYEISLQNDFGNYDHYHTFTEERKGDILRTPLQTFEPDEVRAHIDTLIIDGFFDKPRTALDVLVKYRKKFGNNFHPRYMITTWIDFCDGRKGKKLNDDGKNNCGKRVYLSGRPTR